MSPRLLDVLVVAGWYPAVDDPAAGRFVADQAEALARSGRTRIAVASAERVQLSGGLSLRTEEESAFRRLAPIAVSTDPATFSPLGWSCPPGIPVARLPVLNGKTPASGITHGAAHRELTLGAIDGQSTLALRKARWDIVHAHTGYPDGAAAAALSLAIGAPLVITEHASFVARYLGQPELRQRYLDGLRTAARVIAVSQMLADELRAALPELGDRLVVVPNAVPIDLFRAAPLAARRPDELLFVGYRKESKGIETLLRAFVRVHSERPSATLRLIGRSPTEDLEAHWLTLAEDLGIGVSVRFEPPARREGVAEAMATASLFVHPSPRETFGVVAVEALASGLPVIAADSGGVTEILGDDPDALGAIVPSEDPAALAFAILTALDRRAAFEPERLRASVSGRFDAPVVASRIADLYDAVVDEHGRDSRRASVAAPSVHEASEVPTEVVRADVGSPLVVVCFDSDRAGRVLADLPPQLLGLIHLVTSIPVDVAVGRLLGSATLADITDRVRRSVEVRDHHDAWGGRPSRLGRWLRDPLGVLRRRAARQRLPDWIRDHGNRAVEAGIMRASAPRIPSGRQPGTSPMPICVVCIDGVDYLAVERSVDAGRARLAPGGVRWLADQWESRASDPHRPD